MKFFTREWAFDLPQDKCDEIRNAYRQHIDSLLPSLPDSLALLAKDMNLHDGLIRRVVVDR